MFISDENGLMISETQECLLLVIPGYSFEIIFVKFCFVSEDVTSRMCQCVSATPQSMAKYIWISNAKWFELGNSANLLDTDSFISQFASYQFVLIAET